MRLDTNLIEPIIRLDTEKDNVQSPAHLKEKIEAFEVLFNTKAGVVAFGDWDEFPNKEVAVRNVGYKFLEIDNDGRGIKKVKIKDNKNKGAIYFTIRPITQQ